MGVLETRNLDFKNLIIMSLNEGQLPKSEVMLFFIPYNLRKAFGMTIIEHKMQFMHTILSIDPKSRKCYFII